MQGRPVSPMKVPRQDELSAVWSRLEAEYRQRTPKSKAFHEAACKVLPGGSTRTATHFEPYPVYIERGAGCRLTDVDGNVYLDFLNNYTALLHGHAHPRITEVVQRQLQRGTAYASPIEGQVRLAERLCERVPSLKQVRFCNSGTEATLEAIRAAKAFTGRNRIIKMEGGYHGSHDAAEISVEPPLEAAGPAHAPHSVPASGGLFRGIVSDVKVAPFNDVRATAGIVEECQEDLAAIIVEPVMGAAGMIPATREYLQFLREATQASGALLIYDEVISFRLAYGGAQEVYNVHPDLTALGKSIGGGFPVGAFGGRAEVMACFDPARGSIAHSGTFNGNPVTMAAGLPALELWTREEINRLNQLGERLREGLRAAAREVEMQAQVTGLGSLAQVHFTGSAVSDYRSAASANKELLPLLHLSLLGQGVFFAPRGLCCLSTPMGTPEVDEVIAAFRKTLGEIRTCAR